MEVAVKCGGAPGQLHLAAVFDFTVTWNRDCNHMVIRSCSMSKGRSACLEETVKLKFAERRRRTKNLNPRSKFQQ